MGSDIQTQQKNQYLSSPDPCRRLSGTRPGRLSPSLVRWPRPHLQENGANSCGIRTYKDVRPNSFRIRTYKTALA